MAKINELNFCPALVMHKRLKPAINQFSYRVFYLCFDITKISELTRFFLSLNHFNLFSFYEKDHGKRDGSSLEIWVRDILAQKNLNQKVQKIFLMTYPRVLGYVFNPVSFWFCLDEEENLIAVLAEVNNTFGENHNYLICNKDHSPIKQDQWFSTSKDFHVSPFFEVKGSYKMRFIFNEKTCAAWIDYLADDSQKHLLTSVVGKNEKFSNGALLKGFLSIPLMTLKVISLIHWQALKIILKKIRYIPKPRKAGHNLTFNND